jgi:L-ascorbate peroxidase
MAGACAVEASGGPIIEMKYGRVDGVPDKFIERNFSVATPPFPTEIDEGDEDDSRGNGKVFSSDQDPVAYLKRIFSRLGIDDRETVALCGAHTLGRAFIERSGYVKEGYRRGTKYTSKGCPFLNKSETIGGRSWTRNWLRFDNTYYSELNKDKNTLCLPTDLALSTHPDYKPHFDSFASSQEEFFECYKQAHKKMSELGSQFVPPQGIVF